MADEHLTAAKPPPALNIPPSNVTVKVSCIDSQSRFKLPMGPLLQPDYTGHPDLCGPSFSFLLEHPTRKPVLFDLGIRKDFQVLPSYAKIQTNKWIVNVEKDVATILGENGVDVAGGAIESIIWSHHHWDHVGNPALFPPATGLVVGPGFVAAHLPGYPTRPDATLLQTDVEGRAVREIDFPPDTAGLKIGRFRAMDYFGDGSFYLLDTPGHSVGHLCGLARTTAAPPTFVFMGGDASHHGGEFRPSAHLPLPRELRPSPLSRRAGACPGHLLQDIHPAGAADRPFYHVTDAFAHDKSVADWTIEGLGEFDAHEQVLVLLAHDDAVVDPAQFDMYPRPLNDWYEKGIGKKVKWMFLGDFEGAVEAKARGEEAFVWGKYP